MARSNAKLAIRILKKAAEVCGLITGVLTATILGILFIIFAWPAIVAAIILASVGGLSFAVGAGYEYWHIRHEEKKAKALAQASTEHPAIAEHHQKELLAILEEDKKVIRKQSEQITEQGEKILLLLNNIEEEVRSRRNSIAELTQTSSSQSQPATPRTPNKEHEESSSPRSTGTQSAPTTPATQKTSKHGLFSTKILEPPRIFSSDFYSPALRYDSSSEKASLTSSPPVAH